MINENLSMRRVSLVEENRLVLENVNLSLVEGEIHCLFCQNSYSRAGIISILLGNTTPTKGQLTLSPSGLRSTGITFICDGFELFPDMSVAENLFCFMSKGAGAFDEIKSFSEAKKVLSHYGLDNIPVDVPLKNLTHGQRRMVTILWAAIKREKVLAIEDSLTSYCTQEINDYIMLLGMLSAEGYTVLLITDRFNEFVRCANRISVCKNGTIVYRFDTNALSQDTIRQIFKLDLSKCESVASSTAETGRYKFELRHCDGFSDAEKFSFGVYTNEILGVYDPNLLVGKTLSDAISNRKSNGITCYLNGVPAPRGKLDQLAIITEKDYSKGVFYNLTLFENISLSLRRSPYYMMGFEIKRMTEYAVNKALNDLELNYLITEFPTKLLPPLSPEVQMSIVIARWLCTSPAGFIFINPFVGYNDKTIAGYRRLLLKLKGLGIPSVIISRNITQLQKFSDRVIEHE